MSFASRGSRAAARSLRQTRPAQKIRAYASDGHASHGHGHGHGESALHMKNANTSGNEGLGAGLYLTLAAVPLFYVGYTLAYGPSDNFFDRQFQYFKEGKKANEESDLLHQAVIKEAIRERARVSSYPRDTSGPILVFPELLNSGSPWNQAAGSQSANLKDLEEYYRKANAQAEEERILRNKEGRADAIYRS